MYTVLTFSPLIKYIMIAIISHMYLSYSKIQSDKIAPIIMFIILINIIFDLLMMDNYMEIVSDNNIIEIDQNDF